MDYYNIYGFIFSVEGQVEKIFRKEFKRFAINKPLKELDLVIAEYKGKKSFPIQPKGEKWGLKLPTSKEDNVILYNTSTSSKFILGIFEGYLMWADKCFLHAGAVAHNNKRVIFTGSGNVGKTSLVLQALRRGYEYLSDDWLIIGDGKAYPFPKRLRVFDYNLVYDKKMARKVIDRNIYIIYPLTIIWYYIRKFLIKTAPHRYLKRVLGILRPIYQIDIENLVSNVKVGKLGPIEKVIYLERNAISNVIIKDISPQLLATKMVAMNFFERNYFFQYYYLGSFLNGVDSKIEIGKRYIKEKNIMEDTFSKVFLYHVQIPNRMTPEELWINLVKKGIIDG